MSKSEKAVSTHGLLDNDTRIGKRIQGLFAVGALPASALSVVGDFFGPEGGWIFITALGLFGIILSIYLLAYLSVFNRQKIPFWLRLTTNDKELSWIWSGKTPFHAHGVHVVLLFGMVCLFSAGKTYAALSSGGILASNSKMISSAQLHMGIGEEIVKNQRETNIKLGALVVDANNRAAEDSDPRNKLIKLGYKWTAEDVSRAINTNDLSAVKLFGSLPSLPLPVATVLTALFKADNQEIYAAINSESIQLHDLSDACAFIATDFEPLSRSRTFDWWSGITDSQAKYLRVFCGKYSAQLKSISVSTAHITQKEMSYMEDIEDKIKSYGRYSKKASNFAYPLCIDIGYHKISCESDPISPFEGYMKGNFAGGHLELRLKGAKNAGDFFS